MYLKKLEIAGFKSFATPTTLVFQPPKNGAFSVTAIVGPNGSGKSNIADAIRWVLGEQSLKQLRGKKSEDVIFAGSVGKGKLSVASVSMTLDNSDHRADVDYEELVVGRRLYRTGESEYLVNGNPVRLLDLQVLLAQAQFAHGSYGVIGQGTIDRLLLQSASERKSFFDEAVGIKEFQIKRHQSYLKLVRTDANIAEAERLLAEVEPHVKHLRKQVKKLHERQEIETRLQSTQDIFYATQLQQLNASITDVGGRLHGLENEYEQAQISLTAIQNELAALASEASREQQFHVLQQSYQQAANAKNQLERDRSVLSGRLQVEYTKAGHYNVSWLETKLTEVQAQRVDGQNELTRLRQELTAAEETRTKLEVERAEAERKKIELATRRSALERRLLDARDVHADISTSGLRSVAAILARRDTFGGPVHGLVAELGQVEESFRIALEVAAGSHLSSVVVGDDLVAEQCIRFLKEHQLGVATFLPITKIRPRPLPHDLERVVQEAGVHGLAIDLVKHDPLFRDIFSFVFGATLVVDSVPVARQIGIGRFRMVTLEGDLLETSGSMKGGFRRQTAAGLHFSLRADSLIHDTERLQEEVQRVAAEFSAAETAERNAERALYEHEASKNALQNKISLFEEQVGAIEREAAGLEQEHALLNLDPAAYDSLLQQLSVERDAITAKITVAESELVAISEQMARFQTEEEQKRQHIFALQDTMQTAQTALNVLADKRNAQKLDLVKLETHREDLDNEIMAELKISGRDVLARVGTPLPTIALEEARAEIEKLKYTLSLIGGIDDEVVREYEEAEARYGTIRRELDDLTRAAEDIRTLITELDGVMKKRHAQAFSKIKKEFSRYFSVLFEGGEAELVEVYGEESETQVDEENSEVAIAESVDEETEKNKTAPKKKILTGIEVVACPPGKKIKNIAALSGGERTLTSIALVSAILHTNPPPFVFLDEVEAALDEANTVRFNTILHELSRRSQFILITHNRVTMHAADVLYGVTMGIDGMSRLLSVAMPAEAEALVETTP